MTLIVGLAYGNAYYGEGIGQIAATDLTCVGTEDYLYECDNITNTINLCDHSTDVGVDCVGPTGPCQNDGHTSCCTSGCNAGGCYCDVACYGFGDCCVDISVTCPQSTPGKSYYYTLYRSPSCDIVPPCRIMYK